MRALYTFVFVFGLLAMAPVFAVRAVRHRKYLGSLRERLGGVRFDPDGRRVLWIHAVSVGEVLAVEPLVGALTDARKDWRVGVSTTTATGQRLARERFPKLDVIFFPLDLPRAVERSLDRIAPSAVCLAETEIWPNFLAGCRRRRVPVALVNGRLSDRSFRRYRLAGRVLSPVLDDVALFLMQSDADAERVVALGAKPERVHVEGNLKYDVDRDELETRLAPRREAVEAALGLPTSDPLVVAGSTTSGEEALLAEALLLIRERPGMERTRLLVAPRHPERFDEAAHVLESAGLRVVRRSVPSPRSVAESADALLLDSIGELAAVYAHADTVFVGGSLVPRGGHNIIEPALYARPIVVGPHTENFRQIVADFAAAGAVRQLPPDAANGHGAALLAVALGDLLAKPEAARAMGDRGSAVLEANRGATRRVLERLRTLLASR
jgi:3-deoxy-D-manno-octulosonic-acid transferase